MHTSPPPIPHQRIRCPSSRVAELRHAHHLEHGLVQALGFWGLRVDRVVRKGAGGELFGRRTTSCPTHFLQQLRVPVQNLQQQHRRFVWLCFATLVVRKRADAATKQFTGVGLPQPELLADSAH